jgi:phosphonate transport system substrate-binding protein
MQRRSALTLLTAGFLALGAMPASADWRSEVPELVMAVVPSENAQGMTERFTPFAEYLSSELGVPVRLRIAADYAAVIEGHRAGNIHIGWHGPGSFARAWQVTEGGVEPFVTIETNGVIGYYSVLYVRADSPHQSIADLAGAKVALVDPNSTSGNYGVRYFLDKEGIALDQHFADVVYAGSHENAIIALANGTVDAAANWYETDTASNLGAMDKKGLARKDEFRIVWQSPLLAGPPWALLTMLPAEAKAAITAAFLDAPEKAPDLVRSMFDGNETVFTAVSQADYEAAVEMNLYVDRLRRGS